MSVPDREQLWGCWSAYRTIQDMLDSPVKSFSAVFDMAMAACLT